MILHCKKTSSYQSEGRNPNEVRFRDEIHYLTGKYNQLFSVLVVCCFVSLTSYILIIHKNVKGSLASSKLSAIITSSELKPSISTIYLIVYIPTYVQSLLHRCCCFKLLSEYNQIHNKRHFTQSSCLLFSYISMSVCTGQLNDKNLNIVSLESTTHTTEKSGWQE